MHARRGSLGAMNLAHDPANYYSSLLHTLRVKV